MTTVGTDQSATPTAGGGGAPSLRERLVEAASRLVAEQGWQQVTMGRLADAVGVSRQTVYNEIGTKPQLAETVVAVELERFLALVTQAFDAHPRSLVQAVRQACRDVLDRACGNEVLRAIASATHGADTELLPYLTTHAGPLLETARAVVRERVDGYAVRLPSRQVDAAIDMVVRTVLSHVMQPSGSSRATADDLAWIVECLLASQAPAEPAEVPRPRSGVTE